MLIVFQQKKKKKDYFISKKPFVIGEGKAKFFATTINQYKYQLTIAIFY